MTETFTFLSPLSPQDCKQRLEKLAKKRHFYFSSGSFILHIKIDSIKASQSGFNLFILCSPILSSILWEGLLIGAVVGVAGAGYAWRLYQTYLLGAEKIPTLVYQALQQDSPEKPQGQDAKPSEWVSTLSDTQ